jgi:hypothetical protein
MGPAFIFLFRSKATITDKVDYLLSRFTPGVSHFLKIPIYGGFDFLEFLRFGLGSPKKYELVYVKTKEVAAGYKNPRPHHFGVVRNKYWDLDLVVVDDACGGTPGIARRRTESDVPWESCGELERVIEHRRRVGKSVSPEDPDFEAYWNRRYPPLDLLIDEVRETGRLRTMAEFLTSRRFRERGGIGVCIDGSGHPILTDGHHRFGIMKGLEIDTIPATLHAIHPDFFRMPGWRSRLAELRAPSN